MCCAGSSLANRCTLEAGSSCTWVGLASAAAAFLVVEAKGWSCCCIQKVVVVLLWQVVGGAHAPQAIAALWCCWPVEAAHDDWGGCRPRLGVGQQL